MFLSHNRFAQLPVAVALLAMSTGCAIEDEYRPTALDDLSTASSDGHTDDDNGDDERGCRPEECGTSGVRGQDNPFGHLDLDGMSNRLGFAVVDFIDSRGRHTMLDVVNSQFVGLDADTGAMVNVGQQVRGARIILTEARAHGPDLEWSLVIEEMVGQSLPGQSSDFVPRYRMRYSSSTDERHTIPLCPDAELVRIDMRRDVDRSGQAPERTFQLRCAS